jgi:hypothetical protein
MILFATPALVAAQVNIAPAFNLRQFPQHIHSREIAMTPPMSDKANQMCERIYSDALRLR